MDDSKLKGTLNLNKEEDDTISNEDYEWLTYETIFNQHVFRKTNQRCEMGLYLMPLNKVRILLQRNINPYILQILVEAFFPDLQPDEVEGKAREDCPWQEELLRKFRISSSSNTASREKTIVHLAPRVVMPYNFVDNYADSSSIGTKSVSPLNLIKLSQLKPCWEMWKTASRSCVVKIGKVDPEAQTGQYFWDFPKPLEEEVILQDIKGGTRFRLKQLTPQCFSIKTGIKWVGSTDMKGSKENVNKDVFFGLLQSDMIMLFNEKKGHSNERDPCMVILPEIMGVMENSSFFPDGTDHGRKKGDGFLVRDLSSLDPRRIYIPALSIPFLDKNLKVLKDRFECFPKIKWQNFWKVNYAELLGWAKALLLIRYGLQLETPNAQNFLLEFEPTGGAPKPTGRIFIRDIGDALPLLDIFFKSHSAPQADKKHINEKTFTNPELYPMYQCLGPHSTEHIKLGWHEYSTFSKGQTVANESGIGFDPEARSYNWRFVLHIMAEWGLAHAKAYVRCIQQCLLEVGHCQNPLYREDLFEDYPLPELYTLCNRDDYGAALPIFQQYVDWEMQLCRKIQEYIMDNWMVFDELKRLHWDQKFIPESKDDYKNYTYVSSSSKEKSSSQIVDQSELDDRDPSEWDE